MSASTKPARRLALSPHHGALQPQRRPVTRRARSTDRLFQRTRRALRRGRPAQTLGCQLRPRRRPVSPGRAARPRAAAPAVRHHRARLAHPAPPDSKGMETLAPWSLLRGTRLLAPPDSGGGCEPDPAAVGHLRDRSLAGTRPRRLNGRPQELFEQRRNGL
jgi:hypothetical protein